jgi:hypothetical protein
VVLAEGCAAGAACCGGAAGADSRLHPAARVEESTTVSVIRDRMRIHVFYGGQRRLGCPSVSGRSVSPRRSQR